MEADPEPEAAAASPVPVAPGSGGGPFSADSVLQAAAAAVPQAAQPVAPAGGPFTADSITAALGMATGAAMTPLERMRSDPMMMNLIAMARQNPNLVQSLLMELSTSNPALLKLIQENQADFMSLLNGTAPPPPAQPTLGAPPAVPAGGAPPGAVQIRLTPSEAEAVGRLESMGFDRNAALQAFVACDKDENAAANLLFDS